MTSSERAFAALIRLFPSDFREQFGQDMRELFSDQLGAARRDAGTLGVVRLWLRTIPSLWSGRCVRRPASCCSHSESLRS